MYTWDSVTLLSWHSILHFAQVEFPIILSSTNFHLKWILLKTQSLCSNWKSIKGKHPERIILPQPVFKIHLKENEHVLWHQHRSDVNWQCPCEDIPCWMTMLSSRSFISALSTMRSSTVFSVRKRNTWTCFFCPIRWARSCRSNQQMKDITKISLLRVYPTLETRRGYRSSLQNEDPKIFIPKRKWTSIVSSNWQQKFLYFHHKSVKLDVLGRQNKIWTFGNPFQSKKLPICT